MSSLTFDDLLTPQGMQRLRAMFTELGDKALFALYDGRVPRETDFVTYWFERALIADGTMQRAGLLATSSIWIGAKRRVLERIKQPGDIFMAWSNRPWILDGAAVRVPMAGFDGGQHQHGDRAQSVRPMLNGVPIAAINMDPAQSVETTRRVVSTMNGVPVDNADQSVRPMLNGVPGAAINPDLT